MKRLKLIIAYIVLAAPTLALTGWLCVQAFKEIAYLTPSEQCFFLILFGGLFVFTWAAFVVLTYKGNST